MKNIIRITALIFAIATPLAALGLPVGYDGVLYSDGGNGMSQASATLTFRLFDAATAGNQIGVDEVVTGVNIDGGYFHADLATLDFSKVAVGAAWIEVELAGQGKPFAPRVKVAAVPYANQCGDAATVGAMPAADLAPKAWAQAELAKKADQAVLSLYALAADVVAKADKTWVVEQLAVKANSADVYTKVESDGKFATAATVTAGLGLKADKTYVDDQFALKVNSADVYLKSDVYTKDAVDTKLGAKADQSALTTALAAKANSADMYTKVESDGKFATAATVTAGLGQKADKTYVDDQLALKANSADMYTKVESDGKFATAAAVTAGLGQKADKTYVDDQLALKANSADVYSKTAADEQFATLALAGQKANASDVYPKSDVDAKLALKADQAGTTTALAAKANSADLEPYAKTADLNAPFAAGSPATLLAVVQDMQTRLQAVETSNAALVSSNAGLQSQVAALTAVPAGMVPVGDFYVDKYEASVWVRKDGAAVDCGALQTAVAAGNWSVTYSLYGNNSDDYSQTSNAWDPVLLDTGYFTNKAYACSIKGVTPSRYLTWFQAQAACTAAGKHLVTNGEWQAAVAGTVDPGSNDGTANTKCNTAGSGSGYRATGLAGSVKADASGCVSAWGVEDAIGNLWEWVDLWGQAGPVGVGFGQNQAAAWPSGYAGDKTWNVNGTAHDGSAYTLGIPAAGIRGGYWNNGTDAGAFALYLNYGPSYWFKGIGFRCAASSRLK